MVTYEYEKKNCSFAKGFSFTGTGKLVISVVMVQLATRKNKKGHSLRRNQAITLAKSAVFT